MRDNDINDSSRLRAGSAAHVDGRTVSPCSWELRSSQMMLDKAPTNELRRRPLARPSRRMSMRLGLITALICVLFSSRLQPVKADLVDEAAQPGTAQWSRIALSSYEVSASADLQLNLRNLYGGSFAAGDCFDFQWA